MYAYRTDRVVDVKLKVEKFYNNYNQYARNYADNGCADGVKGVASGGYTYKTCK